MFLSVHKISIYTKNPNHFKILLIHKNLIFQQFHLLSDIEYFLNLFLLFHFN